MTSVNLTKPLSAHAIGELRDICSAPVPTLAVNSGVCAKLIAHGVAKVELRPSPFPTHKGRRIEHLVATPAGIELAAQRRLDDGY
jgi:hypothetical protein